MTQSFFVCTIIEDKDELTERPNIYNEKTNALAILRLGGETQAEMLFPAAVCF